MSKVFFAVVKLSLKKFSIIDENMACTGVANGLREGIDIIIYILMLALNMKISRIFCMNFNCRKLRVNCVRLLRNVDMCPRSSDPFYIVSYFIKWVTTSWTYSR